MRVVLGLSALAALGRPARAQTAPRPPAGPPPNASASALPSVAAGDSLRLTRRQAIAEALRNNPLIEVAREQTAQSRARRVTATAIPDPAFTASIDQQPQLFNLGRAAGQERNVGIGLDVPFPSRIRLAGRVATSDVRASESNAQLQSQLVAVGASAAYDSLLVARRIRDILIENVTLASDFLKRTQARYDAGTVPKLDVIRAQTDLAQARTDLIGSERDVANAQASLNRALGRVIGAPIAPLDSLEVPPPLPDSTTIERVALAARPELAILSSQQSGQRANTSLLKQFWLPDLTLGVSRDYAQPGSPVFTTGVALPLPTFYWQHTRGEIAESQHREQELAASYRDLRAQVTQDVRSAFANANTALKQALFIRDELLPSAREAFRVASVSYSLGGSSALEVLDTRRALQDAQSQLAQALADANTARADLERALGVSLASLPAQP
ncbi:outer membrane efflux protein [Gemmatirosa kalamazoonensis]|uniref:Outer membrane efflux protein n=1 Tax=Gemmatirosa kalamazoonensis TaxID=861299 RepID=W0RKM1_9BACT|nr:TolC family protein [Gemmatirosa kalamazoonensis]AHG91301.1 outer membrane efflux protein [Gemmatirosa kalamazoonensis]